MLFFRCGLLLILTSRFSAFIVGLINTNYAFACLDCATHLAEELPRPERAIPFAILGTVAIGFVTAWFYSIALFFSIKDLDSITSTPTLVPALELFNQALDSVAGAVVLEALVIATGIWCLVACHTWQSRLCWSFARDKGIPFSNIFSKVTTGKGDVPIAAHMLNWFIVSALGLLYLGSTTAFNSMVTACIVLLYMSYSIPVVCLLIRGRENIRHGPFWLGWIGAFSNVVLLIWTVFTLVMYSFPIYYPAETGSKSLLRCKPLLLPPSLSFPHPSVTHITYPHAVPPPIQPPPSLTSLTKPFLSHTYSNELRKRRLRRRHVYNHNRLVPPRTNPLSRSDRPTRSRGSENRRWRRWRGESGHCEHGGSCT